MCIVYSVYCIWYQRLRNELLVIYIVSYAHKVFLVRFELV